MARTSLVYFPVEFFIYTDFIPEWIFCCDRRRPQEYAVYTVHLPDSTRRTTEKDSCFETFTEAWESKIHACKFRIEAGNFIVNSKY